MSTNDVAPRRHTSLVDLDDGTTLPQLVRIVLGAFIFGVVALIVIAASSGGIVNSPAPPGAAITRIALPALDAGRPSLTAAHMPERDTRSDASIISSATIDTAADSTGPKQHTGSPNGQH